MTALSPHRLVHWSLLPGMLALTLLMAFATDVILADVLAGGHDAVALAAAALVAITMAGSVLSAHAVDGHGNAIAKRAADHGEHR